MLLQVGGMIKIVFDASEVVESVCYEKSTDIAKLMYLDFLISLQD